MRNRRARGGIVEAFAVASGKSGTGKTTNTLALGMVLTEEYDVTVIDADTGMANLLFHAELDDAGVMLHDLLIDNYDAAVSDVVYERFGLSVVPCETSLVAFEAADLGRLRDVVAELAADTDVLLLDSPAALGPKNAVLPVVLADRIVAVLQPTVPSLSDGLKVQEYAHSYGTDTAGMVFNRVRPDENVETIAKQAGRYFGGQTLAPVPESDAVHAARREGKPLLVHAPDDPAAGAFREAAARLDVREGDGHEVIERFKSAVVPERI